MQWKRHQVMHQERMLHETKRRQEQVKANYARRPDVLQTQETQRQSVAKRNQHNQEMVMQYRQEIQHRLARQNARGEAVQSMKRKALADQVKHVIHERAVERPVDEHAREEAQYRWKLYRQTGYLLDQKE